MKISTEIGSLVNRVSYQQAIRMVKEAGFDCFDLSLFVMDPGYGVNTFANREEALRLAKELRSISDEIGLPCNQAHAPFPTAWKQINAVIPLAMEIASIVGAKWIIIHPDNDYSPEQNKELFAPFLKKAKELNIGIATENMWNYDEKIKSIVPASCATPKSFVDNINIINSPLFEACVDIGHAAIKGIGTSPYELIKSLGSHVKCIHLHDNDLYHDTHQIPFSMDIDFAMVAKALKEIDYQGEITLEADSYLRDFKDEDLQKGLIDMAKAARKFASMVENAK